MICDCGCEFEPSVEYDHFLAVGDARDAGLLAELLDGRRAQLAVTSPPYGVGKDYEERGLAAWRATVEPVIANLCRVADVVVWQIGDLFATGSQFIEPTFAYSLEMFAAQGYRPLWIRIWLKQGMNFGIGPYHLVSNKPVQQYEYIGAVGSPVADDLAAGDEVDWSGFEWLLALGGPPYRYVGRLSKAERRAWGYAGVWQINTVPANDDHPAMFPVELPERCIKMHSDPGGTVVEPFSGSGTTLIACEKLRRRCVAIEMQARYAAVALERWAVFTGQGPRLVKPGPTGEEGTDGETTRAD